MKYIHIVLYGVDLGNIFTFLLITSSRKHICDTYVKKDKYVKSYVLIQLLKNKKLYTVAHAI